jgi:hypothetical protein
MSAVGGVLVAGSTTGAYLYSYMFNGDFGNAVTLTNLSEGGNYHSISGLNNQGNVLSAFEPSKTYKLDVDTASRAWSITCSDGTVTSGYGSLPVGVSYVRHVVTTHVTNGMSVACAFGVANR